MFSSQNSQKKSISSVQIPLAKGLRQTDGSGAGTCFPCKKLQDKTVPKRHSYPPTILLSTLFSVNQNSENPLSQKI